jgi:hypothetical protein
MQATMRTKWQKKRWQLLVCGIATAVMVVAWFLLVAPVRSANLSVQLGRLKPGMTYSEVTALLPGSMIEGGKEACTSVVWQTTLVGADAKPASRLYCSSKGCWPLNPAAFALIYFDGQDRLIGIRYSAMSGGWSPRWGVAKD